MKSWTQWRKSWLDFKNSGKKYFSEKGRHMRCTGGGSSFKETDSFEKMKDLISPFLAEGIEGAEQLPIAFDFEAHAVPSTSQTIDANEKELNRNQSCDELPEKSGKVICEKVDESIIITDHDYWTENLGNEQILISQEPWSGNVDEMLPEDSTENSVHNTSSAKNPKRRRMATTRLSESIKASQNIQQMLNNKNMKDEMYRVEKFALLERDIVVMKERIAAALEKLVEKLC